MFFHSPRESAERAISGAFLLRYQIVKPYALFHQNEADHALDELDTLHSAYMVTSGTLVNRARQKASGMEHTQIKPESKKNVITVLPPERSV